MNYIIEKERIYVLEDVKVVAEITFPNGVIDHTYVDDSLKGKGIAGILVAKAVEEIEKDGKTVKATCSYAINWLEKHYSSLK